MNDGQRVLNGNEVSEDYVKGYINSHNKRDIDYRVSYTYYYYLDTIMDKNYTLLDIGTGTGGGMVELLRLKKLIAVDGSQKMLDGAKEVLKNVNFEKNFISDLYNEKFQINEKVDAIHLGVYGSYLPFSKNILEHTLTFLKKGGVLVTTLRTPDTLYKKIGVIGKMLLGKKPITQYEYLFEKFILPQDTEILTKVYKYPQSVNNPEKGIVYFIRKI